MKFHKNDTAVVVIDPQNVVLSEKGVSWGLVGDSVKGNNTVENLARLFRAAKEQGFGSSSLLTIFTPQTRRGSLEGLSRR